VKLTPAQAERIKRLDGITGCFEPDDIVLIKAGLLYDGHSRFGHWVRVVKKECSPVAVAGPAKAGTSFRRASRRLHSIDATQAQGTSPVISPPAGALHAEAISSFGSRAGSETQRQTAVGEGANRPLSAAQQMAPQERLREHSPAATNPIPALMRALTMRLIRG